MIFEPSKYDLLALKLADSFTQQKDNGTEEVFTFKAFPKFQITAMIEQFGINGTTDLVHNAYTLKGLATDIAQLNEKFPIKFTYQNYIFSFIQTTQFSRATTGWTEIKLTLVSADFVSPTLIYIESGGPAIPTGDIIYNGGSA